MLNPIVLPNWLGYKTYEPLVQTRKQLFVLSHSSGDEEGMRRTVMKKWNRTRPAEPLEYVMANTDAKVEKRNAIGIAS